VNPALTLTALGIDASVADAVELGCGYGTFTIPTARRISGTLTTFDIEPPMIARMIERAGNSGLSNVNGIIRDVLCDGFGLPDGSQDACLLFNILHSEAPVSLLVEAARVVKPGGVVLATHWRYDDSTPRGPSLDIRPHPEDMQRWAAETQLLMPDGEIVDLPPYHYGLRLLRLTMPHVQEDTRDKEQQHGHGSNLRNDH
jgi:SAM-dependent methyltransferase